MNWELWMYTLEKSSTANPPPKLTAVLLNQYELKKNAVEFKVTIDPPETPVGPAELF